MPWWIPLFFSASLSVWLMNKKREITKEVCQWIVTANTNYIMLITKCACNNNKVIWGKNCCYHKTPWRLVIVSCSVTKVCWWCWSSDVGNLMTNFLLDYHTSHSDAKVATLTILSPDDSLVTLVLISTMVSLLCLAITEKENSLLPSAKASH